MGLTINYHLSSRRELTLAGVEKLLLPLRAKALALGFADVGEPFVVGPDYPFAYHWPRGAKKFADLIPPDEGWIFHATPGDGCESARFGLCRYPGVTGWQLENFCKTQYASRHGWEHFLKCHRGVIELLWLAEGLGLKVKVNDEGRLWDTGSHKVLQRELAEYDGMIAAFGGALKDAAGPAANEISGEIFNDPRFELLEAQGMVKHGDEVSRAAGLVSKLAKKHRKPARSPRAPK